MQSEPVNPTKRPRRRVLAHRPDESRGLRLPATQAVCGAPHFLVGRWDLPLKGDRTARAVNTDASIGVSRAGLAGEAGSAGARRTRAGSAGPAGAPSP